MPRNQLDPYLPIMAFDFEPEVDLPDHPYQAAITFLAVMAYPELGAGQPGALGSEFAGSLVSYLHWQARHHKGLAQFRRDINDPLYTPPQWAKFRGKMNRGLRRIRVRAANYSLFGTRIVNGFFVLRAMGSKAIAEDRSNEIYEMAPNGKFGIPRPELWPQAIRSARGTVANNIDRWSKSFELNTTGRTASDDQKAKDLVRRAVRPSLPVLHMAHALDEACREAGPRIGGWGQRDPALALLMNSDMWIERAIASAERWRQLSGYPMIPDVTPDTMIRLRHKTLQENAPLKSE